MLRKRWTINHIVSKCYKLAQKEWKTRHNSIGKMIFWQSYKRFDYITKWYMHKPESVLENEMLKILLDMEIKMDHLISARRSDLVVINTQIKR